MATWGGLTQSQLISKRPGSCKIHPQTKSGAALVCGNAVWFGEFLEMILTIGYNWINSIEILGYSMICSTHEIPQDQKTPMKKCGAFRCAERGIPDDKLQDRSRAQHVLQEFERLEQLPHAELAALYKSRGFAYVDQLDRESLVKGLKERLFWS